MAFMIHLCTPRLILFLFLDRARSEDVPRITILVGAALERQFAEGRNHVLNGRVLAVTVFAAELIEPRNAVEQIVDNGDDDGDTDRVGPDDNNGDNVNPAVFAKFHIMRSGVGLIIRARQPAEEAEDGSKDVDSQDSTHKLEGRQRLAATGDEDEPVLSEGDFKEEDGLDSAKVLDNTTTGQEEGATDDPGTESEEQTKDNGDQPDLGQLPFNGALLRVGVLVYISTCKIRVNGGADIVGDGDGGQIGEEGKEDNELNTDGLVDDDHRGDEIDLQM